MTAPEMNAAWMPPAVAETSDAPAAANATDWAVMTVMNKAVPAAPANCCTVPMIALPCEYRCGFNDPRPEVNTGVNRPASPTLSPRWASSTNTNGVPSPSMVMPQKTALTMIEPGTTSTVG